MTTSRTTRCFVLADGFGTFMVDLDATERALLETAVWQASLPPELADTPRHAHEVAYADWMAREAPHLTGDTLWPEPADQGGEGKPHESWGMQS